jgi:hypothetical protein
MVVMVVMGRWGDYLESVMVGCIISLALYESYSSTSRVGAISPLHVSL